VLDERDRDAHRTRRIRERETRHADVPRWCGSAAVPLDRRDARRSADATGDTTAGDSDTRAGAGDADADSRAADADA